MQEPHIIFEDDTLLVLDKPSGLVVHSDGRTEEATLVDWLLAHYPQIREVGEPWGEIPRPGIVHRLDRETSGVMVVAKTQEAYEHLKAQFQNREIEKEYRALVHGVIAEDKGVIDKEIGKSPKDFRRWSAQPGARGELREAVTEYQVLAREGKGNEGTTLIAAFPKTGRTHQIRVHMKAIHHPVVGDTLYGTARQGLAVGRMLLHAHKLTLTHPVTGERMSFVSEMPASFAI